MYEIVVYRDNKEVCRCLGTSYLETFLEESVAGNYWVKFKGDFYTPEDLIKYFKDIR